MDTLKIEKVEPLKLPKRLSIKSSLKARDILKSEYEDEYFEKTLFVDEVLDQNEQRD